MKLLDFVDRHRRLFFFTGLGWLALIMAGGLVLSQLDAREGLHVFGGERWSVGQPTALRVGLKDLRSRRFDTTPPLEARFYTRDDRALGAPITLTDYAGSFLIAALTPPSSEAATLKLTGEGRYGPVKALIPLEVQAAGAEVEGWALPVRKPRKRPKADTGPIRLDAFDADNVMPGNLPTTLLIRATSEGEPRSVEVGLELERGATRVALPSTLKTDALGLAWMSAWPSHPELDLKLTAEEPPLPPGAEGPPARSTSRRSVVDTPTQFTLTLGDPIQAPGAPLGVTVRSLHKQGPAYVDVYLEGRWRSTHGVQLSGGEGQVVLKLPPTEALPADPALAWIQVYNAPYQPGKARGGRWLALTTQQPEVAARAIARRLKDAGVEADYVGAILRDPDAPAHASDAQRLIRHLLGRLKRPDADPPLLADSGRSAQLQVQALRDTWMFRMILALVISGVLLFVVVAVLLRRNSREVQAGFSALDGEDDDGIDTDLLLEATRNRIHWGALYMFGVIAMFIIALIQLLTTIGW